LLAFSQPFGALIRCGIDDPKRPIFNWIHRRSFNLLITKYSQTSLLMASIFKNWLTIGFKFFHLLSVSHFVMLPLCRLYHFVRCNLLSDVSFCPCTIFFGCTFLSIYHFVCWTLLSCNFFRLNLRYHY